MVAYWDADQHCVFANRAYERWFGISPEAIIGKHASELLGPLYALNRPYIEAALGGEQQEFEREIPDRAGGPPHYTLVTYIPDVVGGSVRGMIVHVADVSELKRSQLAVAASEARLAAIIAMSSDAIIAVDTDQRITLFNHGAEAIYGYAPHEILGSPLEVLLPKGLRAAHREQVRRFAEGARRAGEPLAVTGVRKNGEEFPVEAAISKIDFAGGTLLTVALRDITERKALETEQRLLADAGVVLAQSLEYKQTLRAIAELAAEHLGDICIVDTLRDDGSVEWLTIAHSDPALAGPCERLAALSLDRAHLLATSVLETRTPGVFDITRELTSSIVRDASHREVLDELALRSAVVVPLEAPTKLIGALVIASRRPGRYAERHVRVATELARRAALAIENSQLYEAARLATRARDEVLGIVAHDVRSPLNTIALAVTALDRTVEGQRARDAVERIRSSVGRATRLIADLLDVRRIEAGVLSIERESVAVGPVIADALESSRLAAMDASIHLREDILAPLPGIHADRDRLLQVLDNLIGNAIKFTPAGGRITVGAIARDSDVVFAVRDTGAGIASAHLNHVFDRFWQGGRTRRDGAGLGLAICKGIVQAHGGKIWVESTPGDGSTFRFSIPVAATHSLRDASR